MARTTSRAAALGLWAWMVASVPLAFFLVLVVLDLPLCTRSSCDGGRAALGSLLVTGLAVLLAVGVPLAWWRVRRVGGRL